MAGHSHWKQIKEQKGSADKKRGALFSKLLRAIAIAAREEANPDFNPHLRAAVEKAWQANVPNENIERAISKAKDVGALEEVVLEAYGHGGAALIIKGITDNKNRTINEIKTILHEHGAKWAEPGSVRWAFESSPAGEWSAKFTQPVGGDEKKKLDLLIEALLAHDDVENVYHNAA